MNKKLILAGGYMGLVGLFAYVLWHDGGGRQASGQDLVLQRISDKAEALKTSPDKPTLQQLTDTYRELGIIDAHNHDASNVQYAGMLDTWKRDGVSKVVLFGNVSEPSAIRTDEIAWNAYQQHPDQIIPYFSGFNLHDPGSLEAVRNQLEKGYFGLGEIAAASTFSPVVSKVAWKADHSLDGYLPQIYDLIAAYKAPILVHIDPPGGMPIVKLEEALDKHKDTIFIFGHMNAYNSPEEIDRLLSKHRNLYADFFAGFAVYNPDSGQKPEAFIPVMKKYPDRFMLSTDSGFGIESEELAIDAMYRIVHLLDDPKLAMQIAHDNLDAIVQGQPATKTQLEGLRKLERDSGKKLKLDNLSKVEAGRMLAEANRG